MKVFAILTIAQFAAGVLLAQIELSLEPNPFEETFQLDFSAPYPEGVAHGILTNNSGETVFLRWEVITTGAGCPETWKFRFCDENFCGSSSVTSNINPGGDPNLPLEIEPGYVSLFDLHVLPFGTPGCCTPRVAVSSIDNLGDTLLMAVYNICMESLTPVAEVVNATPHFFPNPTDGLVSLTNGGKVTALQISNTLGGQVKYFAATPNHNYDLSDLPGGIYLVSLMGERNEVLKTLRIVKR
ncbi:MAG: T9SS type A sorting domain-containing protein [Saprospiraceae bacterium]